jgi:hypothetical protein
MRRPPSGVSDLSKTEQAHVRIAMRCLRGQLGLTMEGYAKALRYSDRTVKGVLSGWTVSAGMAFRVARLAGVSVDAVVTGQYPPPGWTCPHCGHTREAAAR